MYRHLVIAVLLLLLSVHSCLAENRSFIPDSDSFRPVYSTTLTGKVAPDHPLRINTEIRDSETGFVRIYAWGENGTNWNLTGPQGHEPYILPDPYAANITAYPKVMTLKNVSNEYLILDPGPYRVDFISDRTSGYAEVVVEYIYHDQIDMGMIRNQSQSVWETRIPSGLERVVFVTESKYGTDLNLYVEKGTTLPDSYDQFTYHSNDTCTDCWGMGIENYISEMMSVDNPEPGTYLMVTRADGGDDVFQSYWMGIEKRVN